MSFQIKKGGDWKTIYRFGSVTEGDADQKNLLGGKGANLAEMARLGLPIPPGFTVTTEACLEYGPRPRTTMRALMPRVREGMRWLHKEMGLTPLVSIRSGARASMPGMMDTVLNVGLTKETMPRWAKRLGERAMLDCRRRLVQMYATVVDGMEIEGFEEILRHARDKAKVEHDSGLSVKGLTEVVAQFERLYSDRQDREFPDTEDEQLAGAIEAVFKSWNNERAKTYRAINEIPHSWGTAVNVQVMVFGNAGPKSASGVLFSRNPSTGENKLVGEYLINAQGEDVVSSLRTPDALESLASMDKPWPGVLDKLLALCEKLEERYRDIQDVEFTVQSGKLWVLQCRTALRTSAAAFRAASDMVDEGMISQEVAMSRVTPGDYAIVSRPRIDPEFDVDPAGVGIAACPGLVTGIVVFDPDEAVVACEPCILVRRETTPDDIRGMNAAVGILTAVGGETSHAAVVARSLNTACIVGCDDLEIDYYQGPTLLGSVRIRAGDKLTLDGGTGRVWIDTEVPVVGGIGDPAVERMVEWAFEKAGAIRQGADLLHDRQKLIAAEWVEGKADAGLRSLKKLEGMADRGGVIIDLSGPSSFRAKEDAVLWNVFGPGADDSDEQKMLPVIEELEKRKLVGAKVFLPPDLVQAENAAERLEAAGYLVARTARCVGDLLADGGLVSADDDFVENVIGGRRAYEKLLEMLAKAGQELKALPLALTIESAVGQTFGKKGED